MARPIVWVTEGDCQNENCTGKGPREIHKDKKLCRNCFQNARNKEQQQDWESNWKHLYEEDIKRRISGSTCKQDGCSCGGNGVAIEYSQVKGHVNVNKPAAMHGYGEVLAALGACKPICQAAVNTVAPRKERKTITREEMLKRLFDSGMDVQEAHTIVSNIFGE